MGEKGVGKLSRETPPPREGEPMGSTGGTFIFTARCLLITRNRQKELDNTAEKRKEEQQRERGDET